MSTKKPAKTLNQKLAEMEQNETLLRNQKKKLLACNVCGEEHLTTRGTRTCKPCRRGRTSRDESSGRQHTDPQARLASPGKALHF